MSWLDVLSAVFLITGAASCLMGAVGLLTFPDVTARLQAATKPQTLGLLFILIGTAIRLDLPEACGLVLVGVFQLLTSPVLAQLIGRSAYRSDCLRRDTLIVDDLGERIQRERQR